MEESELFNPWPRVLLTQYSLGIRAHECISEEALVHLKSYKYSSVDKSLISHYILRHYVRLGSPPALPACS